MTAYGTVLQGYSIKDSEKSLPYNAQPIISLITMLEIIVHCWNTSDLMMYRAPQHDLDKAAQQVSAASSSIMFLALSITAQPGTLSILAEETFNLSLPLQTALCAM